MPDLRRKDIEILAPVGSYESLMAAVQAGADAVYFGLSNMNMRSRSSVNFDENDLDKILKICIENNIKSYLTLNIVIFQEELPCMMQLVDLAKEKGITAIIASDHSVISYARSKGVDVHISTQVNISNIESVKFYSNFADVMVLARELNMDQVSQISRAIEEENITGPGGRKIRLEMFVHGALCMATSGKCYMSLHEQNHSANRGECLQICRRGYTVKDNETGRELDIDNDYIMSPKDLSTIHFLNKLIDAGVSVLKIEGRARPAEYVKIVTECYSEAVNSIIDGSFSPQKIDEWNERLKTVFNRGFWDGYYLGQKLGDWNSVYGSKATKRKIYVGKCTNYFPNINVGEFTCEASELILGDEVIISGTTTGILQFVPFELRENLLQVENTTKGIRFSILVPEIVRRNDKLFRFIDAE